MNRIRYLIIDVDGTMTDGGIYYDNEGNEFKKFCTRDAAGFFAAKACGIKTVVLTGRECEATKKRMHELQVDCLIQNVKDKREFLRYYMKDNVISKEEIGYIGDDLNDLSAMELVGFRACPADSCKEIKMICQYASPIKGGYGAVRDIIEWLLRKRDEWDVSIRNIYGLGI